MTTSREFGEPMVVSTSSDSHANGNRGVDRHDRAARYSLRGRERVVFHELTGWANSAPLALAAFAVCAFMLSMVNANLADAAVTPYIWGVALMFGGFTQLIAGFIQLRTGNTFAGVLFSAFGGFWLSLFAIAEFFQSSVPVAERGQALGLFLYAFAAFTVYMWLASFRTNLVTIAALGVLALTLFLLAAGNYGGAGGPIRVGGYTGLVVAALAAYLSASGVFEASYGRHVLPVGDRSRG
jgi:uncharacterized protein